MKQYLTEEAFRVVLMTENNSYELYRNAVRMIPEGSGKKVFERLAVEESRIIDEIRRQSQDALPEPAETPLPETVETPRSQQHPWFDVHLREPPGRRLFNHLRIALRDRHSSIDRYATFLNAFREPAICGVFELALGMSRGVYRIIAQEYRQADPATPVTDEWSRAKRSHPRGACRPAPNRHSQLFFSLLDSGRYSLFFDR